MNNFSKRLAGLSLGLLLTLGVGVAGGQHDVLSVKAETTNVEFDSDNSVSGSAATVKVDTAEYTNAMKAGTSSKSGTIALTIPAKSTSLSFYVAAWSGSKSPTLTISCVDEAVVIGTANPSILADSGISNNSPFTLSVTDDSTFKVTTELTNVTAKTTIKLTGSVNRIVVWNPTVEIPETSDPTIKITSDADEVAKTTSGKFTYELKNIEESAATITWTSSNTNSITVDNEGNYQILDGGEATITATLANSEGTVLSTSELKLTLDYGTVTVAKLIEITSGYASTHTSKCKVTVTGYLVDLTSVSNCFVISDEKSSASGNKFNVYQIWSTHALRKIAIVDGKITFSGNPATYNGTAQLTNISYTDYTVDADAYVAYFTSQLATVCADPEKDNSAALTTAWSDLKAKWEYVDDTSKTTLKDAKTDDATYGEFAKKYDHIMTRYGETKLGEGANFIGRSNSTSTSSVPSVLSNNDNSLTITIIVLVSVISVSLIVGTTLIIRKRKVN